MKSCQPIDGSSKSGCFDPEGVQQGLFTRGLRWVEESLATANFGESHFFSTRSGEQGFLSVRWTTLGGIMSIRGKDGA